MTDNILHYEDLDKRHPVIMSETAAEWAKTVRICLHRHHGETNGDAQEVRTSVFDVAENGVVRHAKAEWARPGPRSVRAWANRENEATDRAGCAIALATLELARGMVAVTSAIRGMGADYITEAPRVGLFDYWVSFSGDLEDLESAYRVEVRGVGAGGEEVLRRRLNEKIRQLADGNSNLPAIAMVVGFEALKVFVTDVERE